jgi:signal transduction histidine kinase
MNMALEYFQTIDLDERAAKRLDMALGESKRLGRLLKEILLYANPGSGDLEPVDLSTLVEETVASLTSSSPKTYGNVRVSFADDRIQVQANSDKLRQILINLLSNAWEASPAGESVHLEIASVANKESVRIGVCNATAGDPIDTDRVTEPFYTTKSQGTGLGLAIVKATVEAIRGEFSIEQDKNRQVWAVVKLPSAAP